LSDKQHNVHNGEGARQKATEEMDTDVRESPREGEPDGQGEYRALFPIVSSLERLGWVSIYAEGYRALEGVL